MKLKFLTFFLILFSLSACDHGIAPLPQKDVEPGFSGKVTFEGTWPANISETVVILFKEPLKDSTDFNLLNLRFVSPPIPYGTKEFLYSTKDPQNFISNVEAGHYAYLAVAQQVIPNSFARKAWKVVGIYCANGDSTKAGEIDIPENTFLQNVNIHCDFNHLPTQPPGGVAGK